MSQITKNALKDSLVALLKEKPFSKLKVSDITSNCGVSRMTFYYHFYDIYALLKWIFDESAKRIFNGKSNYANWQEGFLEIFKEIEKNKTAVLNIYRYAPIEYLEDFLQKLAYSLVKTVVDEKAMGMGIDNDDKEFIANFYKFGFAGLVLDWIDGGMTQEPEKIINRLTDLLRGTLDHSLVRFQKSDKK